MDGFSSREGIIVLAATNQPDILDKALLRPGRFDRRVVVNLPDRKGREAILAVEPHLNGKIDRFGISPGGADRYLIAPYRHYRTEDDLLIFHECATDKRIPAANYYECFVFEEASPDPPVASRRPVSRKKRAGPNKPVAKRR